MLKLRCPNAALRTDLQAIDTKLFLKIDAHLVRSKLVMPPPFVFRLLRLWSLFDAAAAAVALLSAVLVLMADVAARELMGQAILGAPQIATLITACAAFFGFSIATTQQTHLRPTMLDHAIPGRFDPFTTRLSDLVTSAAYAFFGWHAVVFVLASQQWGDRAAVLHIPLWPIQSVIPYVLWSAAARHGLWAIWPALKQPSEQER